MTTPATANVLMSENAAAAVNATEVVSAAARAAAVQPAWQEPFCSRYAHLLFEYGRWFLLAALIVGVIGAVAAIVKLFLNGPNDPESGGGLLQSTIAAFTALIDSLAKAPTWIAMLGAALVLMWMSGHALPTFCQGAQQEAEASGSSPERDDPAPANNGAADAGTDDESGG